MTVSLVATSQDRVWRIGAYAVATLIHLPLIVAVQHFGEAIASARPIESVITLIDVPEARPADAVDTTLEVPDAALPGIAALPTESVSGARLATKPAAAPIQPAAVSQKAATVAVEPRDVASIIAADAATPSREVERAAAPSTGTVAAVVASQAPSQVVTAPEAPVPSALSESVAADATTDVAARPEPSSAAALVPVRPSTIPVASSKAASLSPAPPANAIGPSPSLAAAPLTSSQSATSPSTVLSAAPRPRIAIVATGPVATPARTVASGNTGAGAGRLPPLPLPIATPAAPVVAVDGAPAAGDTAGASAATTVVRPVTDVTVSPVRDTPSHGTPSVAPIPTVGATSTQEAVSSARRTALNAFVRGYEGGGCFAALTIATAEDDVSVSGFSRDETALSGFEAALAEQAAPTTSAAARRISEAQCSVLAFARAQATYPDFPVRLTLTPDRIASGGTIGGRVAGAGNRPITMLILDDEGRVQDASFLLARQDGGDWTFQTPLSLTGSPVPTVQLFVVLTGDGPLAAMRPPVPVEARRYFREIDRLLKEKGQSLDVALAAFTVDQTQALTEP